MSYTDHDPVEHPSHYCEHPSGVECIEITEHMNFNLGNATKYIWRAGQKHDKEEDLRKAVWYVEREIQRVNSTVESINQSIEEFMEENPHVIPEVDEKDIPPEWLDPDAGKKKEPEQVATCAYEDYIPTSDAVESKPAQMKASELLPSTARRGGTLAGA